MANDTFNVESGTSYGRQVVLSIINLATKEIAGVSSLHQKGVRAKFNGSSIDVDVYIVVNMGHTVSDVSFRVQENIKRSIETMTSYKVNTINVFIMAVGTESAYAQNIV